MVGLEKEGSESSIIFPLGKLPMSINAGTVNDVQHM